MSNDEVNNTSEGCHRCHAQVKRAESVERELEETRKKLKGAEWRLYWIDVSDVSLDCLRERYILALDAADQDNPLVPYLGDAIMDLQIMRAHLSQALSELAALKEDKA